jgi:hypothetical protein
METRTEPSNLDKQESVRGAAFFARCTIYADRPGNAIAFFGIRNGT